MDTSDVSQWFGEYLAAFAACGRGEQDAKSLLAFYGIPMLLTADSGFVSLTDAEQVTAALQRQIDDARAAGYHHSEVLSAEISVLNVVSSLYRGSFSRHRSDGSEIGRLTATYLVTSGPAGRRISALALHSP